MISSNNFRKSERQKTVTFSVKACRNEGFWLLIVSEWLAANPSKAFVRPADPESIQFR